MKQIVVAVDFSPGSENALRIGVNMASVFSAHLMLLHVCKPCEDDDVNPSGRTIQNIQEAEQKIKKLIDKYKNKLTGNIDFVLREGRVYKVVVEQAKYSDADLIITGTHGVSGFEEFFIGSNAYRIVTSSQCPVLTINQDFSQDKFSKILLPLDASKDTRQKVPFTADLGRAFNAEVTILGINSYDDPDHKHAMNIYCKQSENHLRSKGVKTKTEFVQSRKVAGAIMDYAKSMDADLISIMSEIETDTFAGLLGGNVQRLINSSPIPVVTSHPRQTFNYGISFTGVTG